MWDVWGEDAWGGAAVPVMGGRRVSILPRGTSTTDPYGCWGRVTTAGIEGVRAGGGKGGSLPCLLCQEATRFGSAKEATDASFVPIAGGGRLDVRPSKKGPSS
jgi:hypothetical protein